MNSYELLKSEFDVLMVYEDEAEAVATVMLKANFSYEIEQWVWCGDALLKNTWTMASAAEQQMSGNPEVGLQGITPEEVQQMRVTSKPGRFFGLGKPQYEMTGGPFGHSMQGTQQQLARQMQGMAPGSSPVQAYEQQFGALQQGGPGRLKQALGAMGRGAQAAGQGIKAGWQAAGEKLDAGGAQMKDAWRGDEDTGRVGVKDWGRKAWEGVKDTAASAVNSAQSFETPEQTAERGYQETADLPGKRVPLPTKLEHGMTPSNAGQTEIMGQGDYTQGQSGGNNLGSNQLDLPGLEPKINMNPYQDTNNSQQTSLNDNHPTQTENTEIPIPIPVQGQTVDTNTSVPSGGSQAATPWEHGFGERGAKLTPEMIQYLQHSQQKSGDEQYNAFVQHALAGGEYGGVANPSGFGGSGARYRRLLSQIREPGTVQTSFDAIDHAWDYLLKGE